MGEPIFDRARPIRHSAPRHFTPQQRRIVRLLLAGKTNRQIGLDMGITENTVGAHIEHAKRAAGVHTMIQLGYIVGVLDTQDGAA